MGPTEECSRIMWAITTVVTSRCTRQPSVPAFSFGTLKVLMASLWIKVKDATNQVLLQRRLVTTWRPLWFGMNLINFRKPRGVRQISKFQRCARAPQSPALHQVVTEPFLFNFCD